MFCHPSVVFAVHVRVNSEGKSLERQWKVLQKNREDGRAYFAIDLSFAGMEGY